MTYTMTPRPESKAARVVGHPCCRGSDPAAAARGFTLIEMMITVALIGILSAIAYPSYQQYIIRANRSAVQQFMLNISNREEQFMLDARSYTTTIGAGGLNMSTPPEVASKYTLAVAVPGVVPCAVVAPGYSITATPVAGSMQASDGPLCINSAGFKDPAAKWK